MSNIPEQISSKLSHIESLAERCYYNQTSTEKDKLIDHLDYFLSELPDVIETCEIGQVLNLIELFHLFSSKYRFDDMLDTGVYYSIYILYFKACVLHSNWVVDQLSECYAEMEDTFEKHLKLESPGFLKSNGSRYVDQRQLISRAVMRKIAISPIYLETLLQHTALLSQKGSNLRAKEKSEKCYRAFVHLFRHINNIISAVLLVGPDNLKPESGVSIKTEEAFRYMEFIKSFSIPPYSHIENKWSSEYTPWKFNKDSNDKIILKTIEAAIGNSSLKKKVNQEWIGLFHISSVVKISNQRDFHRKLNASTLDDDLIWRLMLTFSCCIFALAAENRFIVKKEMLNNQATSPAKRVDVSQELKLQKNTQFIYSERVHLKSIEVLLFGFESNIKLITHFLNSYKKNYSFNVVVIEEVNESCFSSAKNSEYYDALIQGSTTESQNMEFINQLNKKMTKVDTKQKASYSKARTPHKANLPLDTNSKPKSSHLKEEKNGEGHHRHDNNIKGHITKNSFSKKSIRDVPLPSCSNDDKCNNNGNAKNKPRTSVKNLRLTKKPSIDMFVNAVEHDVRRKSHTNLASREMKGSPRKSASKPFKIKIKTDANLNAHEVMKARPTKSYCKIDLEHLRTTPKASKLLKESKQKPADCIANGIRPSGRRTSLKNEKVAG